MGGFGTYKLAAQFPVCSRVRSPRSVPQVPAGMLASVRWVPFLMWNAEKDELVPAPSLFSRRSNALEEPGLSLRAARARTGQAPGRRAHPAAPRLALNDQFAPAARFLGTAAWSATRRASPSSGPTGIDFPKLGTTADHAYWVSGSGLATPRSGACST